MDQLFTEAECGDMLREVLANFTAISWNTKEYRLVYTEHSIAYSLIRKDNEFGPALDAFTCGVRDDIRQYAAVAGICKWTWQVAKGIAGNPFTAWRDLLAHFTTAGDFAHCDIVGLTISADGNVWSVTGNHRPGMILRGQTYLNCDICGDGGIRCRYRPSWVIVGSLAAVSIDRMYDTVSVRFYVEFTADIPGVEIRGDSREEVYENLLQWVKNNRNIINICGVLINLRACVNIKRIHMEYCSIPDSTKFQPFTSTIRVSEDIITHITGMAPIPEEIPHRDEVAALVARIDSIIRPEPL